MKVTLVNKVISRGGVILLALFVIWLANPSFKDAFSRDQPMHISSLLYLVMYSSE
ncbi:MAG: hypothetical protein CM15mP117_10100 [Alphaproteobacteria bacterium]|nr:MAG: hypothetical protein CM15mP117_10100 [Alphaproteobacteria bacterium]